MCVGIFVFEQTRLMNQKKLRKQVSNAGCRIYTGSIDCLVQVCVFLNLSLVLKKLITGFCYDCCYCPLLWNELKCTGWWRSLFTLEAMCLNVECQVTLPNRMLRALLSILCSSKSHTVKDHTPSNEQVCLSMY